MCGICGIIKTTNNSERLAIKNVVKEMNNAMHHRGPDDTGYDHSNVHSLAMSRLSIIDLASGKQPIFNENHSIGAFMNGEIYNYKELRNDLIIKGHQFKTLSDTEVLVHLYEEYGTNMSAHLKGMFSFCIFDNIHKQYFFSRDRFGEKPFFYHFKNGFLSFSSEIDSLLQNKNIRRKINFEALNYYLKVGIVPEPITMIDSVFSLPAGHNLILKNGKVELTKYFEIEYKKETNIKNISDAVSYIKPFVENAVKRQMISDVPIGAFLSGGIDSSTICSIMQKYSTEKIKTFTVKFQHAPYDESKIAQEVANHLGTDHHEISIQNGEFSEPLFWNIIDHVGVPFNDSSCIPSFLVSQAIRKHVKVALSGDGGDEVFGGYPVFQWWKKILNIKKTPHIGRYTSNIALNFISNLPFANKSNLLRQLKKGINLSLIDKKLIPLKIHELFPDAELHKIYKNGYNWNSSYTRYTSFLEESKDWTDLRQIMYFRFQHNLKSNMLVKVDRMSMANSLEVRAPFLDPDLFEASTKIPDEFLINKGEGKFIIRKLMQDSLPPSVFNHPKTGFAIPLHKYQNKAYKSLAENLFFKPNPLTDILNIDKIRDTMNAGFAQESNSKISVYRASNRLWSLMLLFGWVKKFNIEV